MYRITIPNVYTLIKTIEIEGAIFSELMFPIAFRHIGVLFYHREYRRDSIIAVAYDPPSFAIFYGPLGNAHSNDQVFAIAKIIYKIFYFIS